MEQLDSHVSLPVGTRGRRGHGTCLRRSLSLSLGWWPSLWGGVGGVSASSASVWGEPGLGEGAGYPSGPNPAGNKAREMLRGNKEASPLARLEASGSAPSQSPSAWVEHNVEKLRCRNPSATDVLHDLGCVTSTAPPQPQCPLTKPSGRALPTGVEEPVLPSVLSQAPVLYVCMPAEETSCCRPCVGGVGTDPDCNCLSPALPSATQPSLSAATHAGRELAPASTQVPYSLLHATLADLDTPSQPPSSTDGGSGTEEVLGAGVGDTALVPSPAMQQPDQADSTKALLDPAGTLSLVAVDISILRGDGELVEQGTEMVAGHPPQDPAQQRGASILPDHPGGLRTTAPAASPSADPAGGRARIRPTKAFEPVTQLRFSRMAPGMRGRVLGGPGDGPRVQGWGLSRLREPEDGGAGPSFDSGFVLSAEQRRKEPAVREGHREPLIYIAVATVVAILLAVGGLLLYKYKSRVLERPLEDGGCDPEEPERRALQGARRCPELETQDL
ncbi:macrophage colony-stimulating factor 1 isoform X2 [Phalacrocorax aristotelis]|uniref:macrophage colony-stimulating factor 1 isoform X2 n=1 Tax=Phalacrocorax aristotelis TaxID=126867 RepID=UPI003F4B4F1C